MARILVVDDEQHLRQILATNLRQDGHTVLQAGGVEEARAEIATTELDVVITDQKMGDGRPTQCLLCLVRTIGKVVIDPD